jgi:esterase/lipase superfamily enzyme
MLNGALRNTILVVTLIFALSFCGCQTQLMPTPNLYVKPGNTAFVGVVPQFQSNAVDILYITDRKPEGQKKGQPHYGSGRSDSAAYGSCIVEIGNQISWEMLVENSQLRRRSKSLPMSIHKITEHGRFAELPLPLVEAGHQLIEDPTAKAKQERLAQEALQEVRHRLSLTSRKEAFLFIHGNFSSFEHAMFVLAGLWHFLGREGVPIAYTWPSGSKGGLLKRYTYDRESGEFTVFHLKQFLRVLASCPELEKIHIVSHSQGTNVITNALRELFIEARAAGQDPRTKFKIANLVLAAPDIDFGVAVQRIANERFFDGVDRLTLYVSKDDRALQSADWLFSSHRLGEVRLDDVSENLRRNAGKVRRTHVIDTRVKAEFFGHSYFYTSPAVSSDLILLLRDNRDPGSANGRPLIELGNNFWQIKDGYPYISSD